METAIFETVLKDVLDEQQCNNKSIQELTNKVTVLIDKVSAFEENQQKITITAPPADTSRLEKIAATHFLEYCRLLQAYPKKIVRQFRFLLFPETNTDYYYKIIFGRLIPWGGLFVVAAFLISLATHYIDRSTVIQERKYKYEVFQETLNRADSTLPKADRDKLQAIFKKVEKEHQ